MKLFIDIETVPAFEDFHDMSEERQLCYEKKFGHELANDVPGKYDNFEDHYSDKAALYAEFGKIVCVSMGYVANDQITLKSFYGDGEKEILAATIEAFEKAGGLVAHNGKDFDYPWLCRRMMINGLRLPALLQIQNLKPWEIKLEDTAEMWKFGQFQHRASLALMCNVFGLPSPKAGMDGSQVAEVFYKEKNYKKIADYCEGDVVALINVYRKMLYYEPLTIVPA
jgi:3'-5' exonuclease